MEILACGAGMQSSALALMSCENVETLNKYPMVPIYDLIVFCDLGKEPTWVYEQVDFVRNACRGARIKFVILQAPLYDDYLSNFGKKRVSSIPFWTISPEGKKGKMIRACTMDYKINLIQKYVREELLNYKKGEWTRKEDLNAHGMHIGFSFEERERCKENPHKMFVNHFPLVEMKLERKDNYAYIRDVWGLVTRASACTFCPFHRNYFFYYLKQYDPKEFLDLVLFDEMLEQEQPNTAIKSKLYISRSRKRIANLKAEECQDSECFLYRGIEIWNGF